MVTLLTPLEHVLGKGPRAKMFRTHRGIDTVEDLLWFLPRRYLNRQGDVTEFHEGDYAVVFGEVVRSDTRRMGSRRGMLLKAVVRTDTGELDVTFFRSHGHIGRLVSGAKGLFAGRVSRYNGRWQLTHPSYELFKETADNPVPTTVAGRQDYVGLTVRNLYPVYLEVPAVQSWTISNIVSTVLATMEPVEDPLPLELRERRALPTYLEAMRKVHLPEHLGEVAKGKERLKYDEALIMQLVLGQRRRAQEQSPAVPRKPVTGGLLEAFDARLPFELTEGQRDVGEQIAADLARPHPMHRLLQGEVGSGKTVVALRAMLSVIDAGGQAALLAPTEVLAAQHYRSITAMLGELAERGMLGGALDQGTRVVLLTGSQSAAARKEALLAAASGEAGIVIGTHALIQKHVQLADLGLVVVDEQHRFGVEQRDALRGKAKQPPHMLVMTATPIPRTVAMTVFGDMDTSVLTELPPGRQPISSHVVGNRLWYARCWERVAAEVRAGRQVYVVCPRIGEEADPAGHDAGAPAADTADAAWLGMYDDPGAHDAGTAAAGGPVLRGVLELTQELRGLPELAGARVEIMHGRLPTDEKDRVMGAFAAGDVDVLVSTTVIEVGVDVPNATVMVVMDADRFGISQLHQLRGRVGRGGHHGLCLFVLAGVPHVDHPGSPGMRDDGQALTAGVTRLKEVAATTDGFALSRLDLKYRREGDILGARQSGATSLRLLSLRGADDEGIIERAREDAATLLDGDPTLAQHPHLAYLVSMLIDEEQAAFLERG